MVTELERDVIIELARPNAKIIITTSNGYLHGFLEGETKNYIIDYDEIVMLCIMGYLTQDKDNNFVLKYESL